MSINVLRVGGGKNMLVNEQCSCSKRKCELGFEQ